MTDDRLVAVTVPLHLRLRRKAPTELLASMRPQTAVAIGPHCLKCESQGEMRIAETRKQPRTWRVLPEARKQSGVYEALGGPRPSGNSLTDSQ